MLSLQIITTAANDGFSYGSNGPTLSDMIVDQARCLFAAGVNSYTKSFGNGFTLNSGTSSNFVIEQLDETFATVALMPTLNQPSFGKSLNCIIVDTSTNVVL